LKKWPLKLAKSNRPLLFLFLCLASSLNSWGLELVDKTIAIVNNEPILLSDLKQLENRLSKSAMIDDLMLLESSTEALRKDAKAQIQFLINERIIDSEVKKHNLSVTMERVDQEIRDIARRYNLSKEDLLKTLQSQGIDIAEYQLFMKQRIERQSLIEQEITSKIRLNDEDVLAFYNSESGRKLNQVYEYGLGHIFFDPNKNGPDSAQERAEKTHAQIRQGQSFDSLLNKHTEDTDTAANGFLGTFKSGEFSPEMEYAVKNLNIGETSGVVKSRSGYHILKLVSKKRIPDPEFDKNKEKFRGLLFERVFKRQFKSWIEQKRDDSSIKLNS
jgi:peptidyl-prolyl cis-trans isomerase SurA